jgi:hypothetical protein
MVNLLEESKFLTLADRLHMIKRIASESDGKSDEFAFNAEQVLADITKVLQTCVTLFKSSITEYERKQKELLSEPKVIVEVPVLDPQQTLLVQQKDLIIDNLNAKYEHMTDALDQLNRKRRDEFM